MAFRLSGSYTLPLDINLAGSLISNNGYPYQSHLSRSRAPSRRPGRQPDPRHAGRAVQRARRRAVRHGDDDGHPAVAPFNFGSRSITPQVDFFNLTNADTTTALNNQVGTSYLFPSEILSPRIIRVGFSFNF